jgi:hypothetical protein
VLGEVVADGELRPHDSVRLGVPAAFEVARVPEAAHLRRERLDDAVEVGFLVGLLALLGEREALVLAAAVDQPCDEAREPLAQ